MLSLEIEGIANSGDKFFREHAIQLRKAILIVFGVLFSFEVVNKTIDAIEPGIGSLNFVRLRIVKIVDFVNRITQMLREVGC